MGLCSTKPKGLIPVPASAPRAVSAASSWYWGNAPCGSASTKCTVKSSRLTSSRWWTSCNARAASTEMARTVRARYPLEFKREAVLSVTGEQSIAAAARSLGSVEQTLFNCVKADRQGRLNGADTQVMSVEPMEISRLRAELARVKMERDILVKATAAQAARSEPGQVEVRLHQPPLPCVADLGAVSSVRGQRGRVPRALRSACQRRATALPQPRRAGGVRT